MVKLTVKAEGDHDEVEVLFSNEILANYNYVEMCVEGKCYMFSVTDLEAVAAAFKRERENFL